MKAVDDTPELERKLRQELVDYSRRLVDHGLLEFKGGNLSVRVGTDDILITRRSAAKGIPSTEDIVRTSLVREDENAYEASSAMEIHRAIYLATDARAVIHAHPSKTVSLSFFFDEIEPVDENGLLYLGRRVPVVAAPTLFGWNLIAEAMGNALIDANVSVEKWHGTFAKGRDLAEAFHRTRAVEFMSSHIIRVAQLRQYFGEPRFPPTEVAEVLGGVETRGLRRVAQT